MGVRLSLRPPAPIKTRFDLAGQILPLHKAQASPDGWVPSRPLGGWLATYGKIGPNGGIVPTQDRQGHVFEAASALGMIDFSDYLTKGKGIWNDTHTAINVGVPTLLEFHDGTTPLSKAHRKVGFWTEGHLFDRSDPRSWAMFGDYEPTPEDLAKADYFWALAGLLQDTPRALGFSAQGTMLLSPCGKRIIWAKVSKNAVCEVPQNPDATAHPLALAVPITRSMVGALPCATCRCPPGARCKTIAPAAALSKAVTSATMPAAEDLEDEPEHEGDQLDTQPAILRLVAAVQRKTGCNRAAAVRWVRMYLKSKAKGQNGEAHAG